MLGADQKRRKRNAETITPLLLNTCMVVVQIQCFWSAHDSLLTMYGKTLRIVYWIHYQGECKYDSYCGANAWATDHARIACQLARRGSLSMPTSAT